MSIYLEAEARQKACPQAANFPIHVTPRCIASGCMAWRWYRQPKLRTFTSIPFNTYVERADKYGVTEEVKARDAAHEACNQLREMSQDEIYANEEAWERAAAVLVEAMAAHEPPDTDFPNPGLLGGWEADVPEFDEDQEEWRLLWTRESDPNATGFCGACPVPPCPSLEVKLKSGGLFWIDPRKDDAAPGEIRAGE